MSDEEFRRKVVEKLDTLVGLVFLGCVVIILVLLLKS